MNGERIPSENLYALLNLHDVTARDAATCVGVSERSLWRFKQGHLVSTSVAARVAWFFGITVSELIGDLEACYRAAKDAAADAPARLLAARDTCPEAFLGQPCPATDEEDLEEWRFDAPVYRTRPPGPIPNGWWVDDFATLVSERHVRETCPNCSYCYEDRPLEGRKLGWWELNERGVPIAYHPPLEPSPRADGVT